MSNLDTQLEKDIKLTTVLIDGYDIWDELYLIAPELDLFHIYSPTDQEKFDTSSEIVRVISAGSPDGKFHSAELVNLLQINIK